MKILFLYPNCMMDNLIPVGLSSIAGAVRDAFPQAELRLFDTTFYPTQKRPPDYERVENLQIPAFDYEESSVKLKTGDFREDFRHLVETFKPDIILLSVVESTFPQAITLLETIRDIRPYTIAGGIYALLSAECVINEELIDAVCISEGEHVVVEACRAINEGRALEHCKGIWFKQNKNILRNEMPTLVDLDNAPFADFSLFEKERFFKPMQGRIFKMLPIEFSRGCIYHCSYCANHAIEKHFKTSGKWMRWKSLDRIFAEMRRMIASYDVKLFYFVSETFLAMPEKMFSEFCERYSEIKIPYWLNTRPEIITEAIAAKLKATGCFRIGLGVEHGNPEYRRKILNRYASNEAIIRGCAILRNEGISFSVNNIIGLPGESRELVFDTIKLNRQINANSIGTFVFTAFQGTELYEYSLKHGYLRKDILPGDLNKESVLINNPLSPSEIKGLLRTFPLYVQYGEEEYPEIAKAELFTEEGNRVFEKFAKRYSMDHFGKPWRRMP